MPRLVRIGAVIVRYRLDDLFDDARRIRVLRWARLVVPRASAAVAALPRGERLVLALTELGPIFVKFGQILSTRRDLLPADIAGALTQLQDRVAPFPGSVARAAIERALGAAISERYAEFDETPLASASIAQVHAATLH
ncbi:MAG: AarF/UbiB family protein, partial [Dokdonella sp.]